MKIIKQKPILDIFSKIKTKKKFRKKQTIIIDYREKNSLVPAELVASNLNIEFKELKVADYIVKGIAIERKTVSDFISSMKNRRLLKQLQELQQYKKNLLIIEGIDEQDLYTDSQNQTGIHPNSVRGFLLSIVLKYNVPLIFSKNAEDTAKFITLLSKKKEAIQPLNVKKKNLNKKQQLQFIIESFPGIGPATSKKLLTKFKSIKNIINSSEEELKKCIGKKAKLLKQLTERNY